MSVAMSQRAKRLNRLENDGGGGGGEGTNNGGPPPKRRKGRPPLNPSAHVIPANSITEDDDSTNVHSNSATASWQPKPITDLKISNIYNRSAPEAPAELFRKDLISAMKLPDSEPLAIDEYWTIADQWKQEWERGVQVPVNPDSLPEPSVKFDEETFIKPRSDFKLPKNKYIRVTKDEHFSSENHYLSNTPVLAEEACSYDIDQCDEAWLKLLNRERQLSGLTIVSDEQFERVIEELETRCWDKIQAIMKNEEGLGIEYDENVICDVCRSPDSEELNEMVFCDRCNICVHQACYGITAIPSGQWLCRTCSLGIHPDCVLCPNKGGAMKSTRSGQKWAHVSCALWIPEVSIGSVDRMEPITKISNIPQSRWALICVLCRERVGACIQCSVKTCKTAYHVTCAFQHGLEMRAIIEDENAEDGVKLRSYCVKHSVNKGKKDGKIASNNNQGGSGSDDDDCKRKKQKKDMTSEERNQARIARLAEVQSEFDKHVNVKDISCHLLDVDQEAIHYIYNYWILKRKSLNNNHLLPPKTEGVDMISQKQGQADLEKMKNFVHLRQDLERVRNLCYMVSRREKLSRSYFKMREQTFYKQVGVLMNVKNIKAEESLINAVMKANRGPSIYDKFYSSDIILNDDDVDLEDTLSQIIGTNSSKANSSSAQKLDVNGVKTISNKHLFYINGVQTSTSTSSHSATIKQITKSNSNKTTSNNNNFYSSLSSNDSDDSSRRNNNTVKSSNDDDDDDYSNEIVKGKKKSSIINRSKNSYLKTATIKGRKKSKLLEKKIKYSDSSSDDDVNVKSRDKKSPRNRTLHQMERELAIDRTVSGSESDELLPIHSTNNNRTTNNKFSSSIYSDSDDSDDKDRTDNTASDSQMHTIRTKAAMKEFIPQNAINKNTSKNHTTSNKSTIEDNILIEKVSDSSKSLQNTKPKDVINKKIPDFPTDLLVVPQRQAAKKASENLKSNSISSSLSTPANSSNKKDKIELDLDKNDKLHDKESTSSSSVNKDHKDKEGLLSKEGKSRGRPPIKQKVSSKNEEKKSSNKTETKSSSFTKIQSSIHKDDKKEKDKDRERDKLEKEREREREREKEREFEKEKFKERDKEKEREREREKDREREKEREKEKERDKQIKENIDMIAYVPQRQAAKKAAEHIKSGLVKPTENISTVSNYVPVEEKAKSTMIVKKEEPGAKKSKGFSISSSSASESSYSSSCSDSDEFLDSKKNTSASSTNIVNKKTPENNKTSSSSLPFLDKGSKAPQSTSVISSDDSIESIRNVLVEKLDKSPKQNNKKKIEPVVPPKAVNSSSTSGNSNSVVTTKKPVARRLSDRKPKVQEPPVVIDDKPLVNKSDLSREDTHHKNTNFKSPISKSTPSSSRHDRRKSNDVPVTPPKNNTKSPSPSKSKLKEKESEKTINLSDEEIIVIPVKRRRSSVKEVSVEKVVRPVTPAVKMIEDVSDVKHDVLVSEQSPIPVVMEEEENIKVDTLLESKKETDVITETIEIIESEPKCVEIEPLEITDDKLYNRNERDDDVTIVVPKVTKEVISITLEESDSENKPDNNTVPIPAPVIVPDDDVILKESRDSGVISTEPEPMVIDNEITNYKPDKTPLKQLEPLEIDVSSKGFSKSSIFSPNSSSRLHLPSTTSANSKDGSSSLFDFSDELLSSVGDTATDVQFGLNQTDEIFKSTPFSFGNDVLFKEDCKEDSARETLNVVEKLRQKYKKQPSINKSFNDTNKIDSNTEPVEMVLEPPIIPHDSEENNRISDKYGEDPSAIIPTDNVMDEDKSDNRISKLDHSVTASSDERWVPPSDINMTSTSPSHQQQSQSLNITHSSPITQTPATVSQQQEPSINKFSIIENSKQNSNNDKENLEKLNFVSSLNIEQTSKEMLLNSSKYDDLLSSNSPLRYAHPHPSKWSESQMITTRRSVSSSPPSSGSESGDDGTNTSQQHSQNKLGSNNNSGNNNSNNNATNQHDQMLLEHIQQIQSEGNLSRALLNEFQFNHLQQQSAPQHSQNMMQSFQQPHNTIPTSMESLNYNYQDSSQFISPVSLFPPSGMNTQNPFPSPGTAIFPSPFPPSYGSANISQQTMIAPPPVSKSTDLIENNIQCFQNNSCTAAFTSSSHNLALTAAIVSPSTTRSGSLTTPIENVISNLIDNPLPALQDVIPNHTKPSPHNDVDLGTKMIRSSPRFVQQQQQQQAMQQQQQSLQQQQQQVQNNLTPTNKSPSKSPGKSPRQMLSLNQQQIVNNRSGNKNVEPIKPPKSRTRSTTNQTKSRTNRNTRGGRGRTGGNLPNIPPSNEFDYSLTSGTIHNKLVGTVYDLNFDDDIASDSVKNLKPLRHVRRRSSIDCRLEPFRSRDSPQSPKFMSIAASTTTTMPKILRGYMNTDVRELRPPSPIHSNITDNSTQPTSIHNIVPPVLPGPVDMRTYSGDYESTASEAYNNNLLVAFASGTADRTIPELDEEMEKEFQSALKASTTKPSITVPLVPVQPPQPDQEYSVDQDSIKVSLSDSRNQLKLKIKGPLAHPDYTSSSVSVNTQQMSQQIDSAITNSLSTISNNLTAISNTPGTSSLRRMRKKELLRQYWTQDMNMDDGSSLPQVEQPSNLIQHTPVNRSVGIPKAVDSMSSIPTKEDYKDYTLSDLKKRKKISARELQHLDISLDDSDLNERHNSFSDDLLPPGEGFNIDSSYARGKRRTRGGVKEPQLTTKLKIKIGGTNILETTSQDDKRISGRPLKKRIANMPVPSLEDYRRESMNYRKEVMAQFDEAEKVKKVKKSGSKKERKEEKKKKKKDKIRAIEMSTTNVIGDNNGNPPKLIIRIGKRKADELDQDTPATNDLKSSPQNFTSTSAGSNPASSIRSSNLNESSISTITPSSQTKLITPIRLKIAKNSEGSGYVSKDIRTVNSTDTQQNQTDHINKKLDSSFNLEISNVVSQIKDKTNNEKNQLAPDPDPPPPPQLNSSSLLTSINKSDTDPLPQYKDCEVR